MKPQKVVSYEEWLTARKQHLKNEKALTRMRDMLARERRALPWVKVDKRYVFDTAEGRKTLGDLFGNNSQLIVQHSACGGTTSTQAVRAARSTPTMPRARWCTSSITM